MAQFFNYYPKTFYSSNADSAGVDTVTNIITRFGFEDTLKQNSSAFYKYTIKDTDTPEIIADKFYGNSERHWIVLLFNNIIDPQYEWPLQYPTFIKYVDSKYSDIGAANTTVQTGLEWAKDINNTQSYFKIVTRADSNGGEIEERVRVDVNTFANVGTSSSSYTLESGVTITETITTQALTYYDYENELNEGKREINLLKKDFVAEVEKEFKRVIR